MHSCSRAGQHAVSAAHRLRGQLSARPTSPGPQKNPEVLAFVCGGLFGLVPSASTFLAAPPDELARAVAVVATTPIWTSGRWPFLGFIPVSGPRGLGRARRVYNDTRARRLPQSFGHVSQRRAASSASWAWGDAHNNLIYALIVVGRSVP